MAEGESDYHKEHREASALAAVGKEEGITRLFELRRRAHSAELSEALVVDLYYHLHRAPELWVRALAKQDPKRMKAFLRASALGAEIPDASVARAACSTEIIARLEKFHGLRREEDLAAEVIEALRRTMKE